LYLEEDQKAVAEDVEKSYRAVRSFEVSSNDEILKHGTLEIGIEDRKHETTQGEISEDEEQQKIKKEETWGWGCLIIILIIIVAIVADKL
jgi:hypothetical protein